MTKDDLAESLEEEAFDESDAQLLVEAAKTCTQFTSAHDTSIPVALGGSKLGGEPDLPPDFDWPKYKATPLTFIAQIQLSDALASEGLQLPHDGLLSFFYEAQEMPAGYGTEDAGAAQVFHFGSNRPLKRRSAPENLESGSWYPECHLEPCEAITLLDSESDLCPVKMNEDESYVYREHCSELWLSGHQLGGHPDVIQEQMELECQLVSSGINRDDGTSHEDSRTKELEPGAADWVLLLQIDSDRDAKMMWGDNGSLFVWIRKQDLAAGRFEKTWTLMQCH